MEIPGFGGMQTTRTKRFHEQYKVGMQLEYRGKKYKIEEIKEQSEVGLAGADVVMVCYLKEED